MRVRAWVPVSGDLLLYNTEERRTGNDSISSLRQAAELYASHW
jgi:hypothetical protein